MYNKSRTSAKGRYGEQLVDKMLKDKGYKVSQEIDDKHIIDRIVINRTGKKIAMDVKTKAKMKYYPATGFDLDDYVAYKKYSKDNDMRVIIIFVDEDLGEIYGNYLDVMEEQEDSYPKYIGDRHGKQQIIFPLSKMITYRKLISEEINTLKILKSYYDKYEEVKNDK